MDINRYFLIINSHMLQLFSYKIQFRSVYIIILPTHLFSPLLYTYLTTFGAWLYLYICDCNNTHKKNVLHVWSPEILGFLTRDLKADGQCQLTRRVFDKNLIVTLLPGVVTNNNIFCNKKKNHLRRANTVQLHTIIQLDTGWSR